MPIDSPIFNEEFISITNTSSRESSHFFVLKHYNENILKNKNNCIIDKNMFRVKNIKLLLGKYDFVVLHSNFFSKLEIMSFKTRHLKKMIWCVWGHDLYKVDMVPKTVSLLIWVRNILKSVFKPYIDRLIRRRISKFAAVVIGYNADKIEIKNKYGKIPILSGLYGSGYYKNDIDSILEEKSNSTQESINILIGHNAFPYLKHEKYLNILQKYKNENIKIYLLLSYGYMDYAEKIANMALSLYKNKVVVINAFMDKIEYLKLLSNIDIAIFDFEHQAAFGNLISLIYMKKKIYLSAQGIMSKGLRLENIIVYDCDDIGKIDYKDFVSHDPTDYNTIYVEKLLDKEYIANQWNNVWGYFENNSLGNK